MKEVIKKVIDFYKENVGTRWLIKDIIVSVLLLTIMAWNLQMPPLFVFGIILYGISFLMITIWAMAMKCALIKTLKIFKEDK